MPVVIKKLRQETAATLIIFSFVESFNSGNNVANSLLKESLFSSAAPNSIIDGKGILTCQAAIIYPIVLFHKIKITQPTNYLFPLFRNNHELSNK